MHGFPDLLKRPRNSVDPAKRSKRRSSGWASISTGPPLNTVALHAILPIVRHFAERTARFWCSLSFLSAVSEWRADCTIFLHRCSTKSSTSISHHLLGLSGLADREVEIIEGDLARSMGELPDLPERPQESGRARPSSTLRRARPCPRSGLASVCQPKSKVRPAINLFYRAWTHQPTNIF